MSSDQTGTMIKIDDETYMKIWKAEQQYVSTRWSTITFFLSISFAISGLSFQNQLTPYASLTIRISGLILYWFAYALYLHFYKYTHFLRSYLIDMELSGRTTHDIQGRARIDANTGINKYLSTRRMLLYFGLLYMIGVTLLFLLRL